MTDPVSVTQDLLPCPFCGANDVFVEQSTFASSYAICNDCMARGPDETQNSDEEDEPGRDAAITAWNTRPTPDTRPAAAGSVREAAVRIERFVSMMVPQMSLTFRRNNEAEIVRMAHDFAEIRALAAAPTPDAAASEAREVLPQHIGRLHLGERRSDGERLCSHGHPVAAGQALYWPQLISQYDDIDPLCLAHAIEQAVDDNGWCECDARAALTTQGGAEG